MGETKSTDYIPENANEEYALLVGRLKAFAIFAARKLVALMEMKK